MPIGQTVCGVAFQFLPGCPDGPFGHAGRTLMRFAHVHQYRAAPLALADLGRGQQGNAHGRIIAAMPMHWARDKATYLPRLTWRMRRFFLAI